MKKQPITEKQLLLNIESDVKLILNYKIEEPTLEIMRQNLRSGIAALDKFRADKLKEKAEQEAKREAKKLGVDNWMKAVKQQQGV